MAAALPVMRALPRRERRFVGPFCFLDHFGPHAEVGRADGGVAPHPHIGLATATYLFDGAILHRDSLGTAQRIVPGDVNWMTAGRGIVHSERTPPEQVGVTSTSHGLQIWVALPTAHEDAPPSFQHAPGATLPVLDAPGVRLRVLLGAWDGVASPVQVWSPLTYVIAELADGATLAVPGFQPERALYVVDGAVTIAGEPTPLGRGELAVLRPDELATLTATAPTRVAVFGGAPLDGPRYLLWNFVASSKARLEQARLDWIARRFPIIPDDDGYIPFP
ncbi:MAG: pirin family protein [Myxococcales bacterium]|nr:pirin family protein [Myxococcales bacterium]